MNSGEIAAWIGDAITFLAFVSFLIVERDRLFSHKKAIQPDSVSSNLIDIGLIDNLRSLIYTRILIGIILGFAL